MNATTEISQGASHDSSSKPTSTQTKNYQDEAASRESKLKAIWDEHMGDVKKRAVVFYRRAVVLLLSWHPEVDDLHTDKEVSKSGQEQNINY